MKELFDELAAGVYLGGDDDPVSPRTMQRWRQIGEGPAYLKIGHVVRYEREALDHFKVTCRRKSTSEPIAREAV